MSDLEIPIQNVEQLETAEYADGDFDLEVWQDEIQDLRAEDIAATGKHNTPK